MFLIAQESPATRFERAIESIVNAELAAREMGSLSLERALALVVLHASTRLFASRGRDIYQGRITGRLLAVGEEYVGTDGEV